MGEKSEAPSRGPGFFGQLIEQVRLSWALLLDSRVPWVIKLIPIGAVAYVISPIDLIPDFILGLGQLDDLGILFAALRVFNSIAPADIVAEHTNRLRGGDLHQISRDSEGTVIDVEAHRD
jgi:uncharacterized membrane protein YkvA (DUF1232 family)